MKRFFEGAAITFAVGLVIFLIVLLVGSWGSKADAAEPVITPIDSCLDGWFWKAGTGEKETPPSLTPDGLYFNDNDTVNAVIAWHFSEVAPDAARIDTVDKWGMVDFAAAGPGSPGPNTAFKFLTSPWTGTWNYQGDGVWWKSAGGPVDINSAGTYTNDQMVEALGNYDAVVAAFGVGTETISVDQPGFIIERIFFAGEAYSLKCAPEVVVSTVPGPVVVRTVTVTPSVTPPVTTSPAVIASPTASRTPTRTTEVASGSSDDGTGMPWTAVAAGAAALVAAGSTVAAVAAARRRRQNANADLDDELDNDETAVIPYVDNGDAETERFPRQE